MLLAGNIAILDGAALSIGLQLPMPARLAAGALFTGELVLTVCAVAGVALALSTAGSRGDIARR